MLASVQKCWRREGCLSGALDPSWLCQEGCFRVGGPELNHSPHPIFIPSFPGSCYLHGEVSPDLQRVQSATAADDPNQVALGGPQPALGRSLSSFMTLSILMTTGEEVGVEGHTNDRDSHLGDHTLSSSHLFLQGLCLWCFLHAGSHVNTCALIKDALVPHPLAALYLSPFMHRHNPEKLIEGPLANRFDRIVFCIADGINSQKILVRE